MAYEQACIALVGRGKMMEIKPTQVSKEFSIRWAASNQELFERQYNEFFRTYGEDYSISSYAREGFLTLIADEKGA